MSLDERLFHLLHHRAGELSALDRPLLVCARHGALIEVLLMLLAGTGGRRGWKAIARCLAAVALIYLLTEVIGVLYGRIRPFAAHPSARALIDHPPTRSFPSRHVASAIAMARIVRPVSPCLAGAMAGVAGGLAAGRVRAGLHYPSDVVAGAALGAVVGGALRSPSAR